ncbi:unnamed protein product [Mytilus edulis]|uniref:Uncharacterized protein n=1 Tax=Mytilus edulis TaxID=6550 RepID=A0A8S3SFA4_MYTED|nr:unnamed protein product [Mytilus edulis]
MLKKGCIKTKQRKNNLIVGLECVFGKISGPIIFGDSVVLRCYVSEDICDADIRKSWGIGSSNRVISSNGQSYYKNKYKMISNNISGNYDLEILRFNEKDMVNVYTYSCGFKSFSKSLTTRNYVCYPSSLYVSKVHVHIGIIRGSVRMTNVFPFPNCTVISGLIHHNIAFHVSGDYVRFRYTEIITYYKINAVGKKCDHTITVVCLLGKKIFKEVRKTKMYCKSDYIIPLLVVTGVIITCITAIFFYKSKAIRDTCKCLS